MSQNSLIALLIVGLIVSNAAWIVALYRIVSELTNKIMAGTLDNYSQNAPVIKTSREPLVRPSLKDKSPKEESALKDGAPAEYTEIEDMAPEDSLKVLKQFAEDNGVEEIFAEAEK